MNELTINELESVNGGVAFYAQWFAATTKASVETVEFEGSTIFAGGGSYDHDEGVCYPD